MRLPVRRLLLILYAAFGPPMLHVLYLLIRDHLGRSLSLSLEDAMLFTLVASGAACTFIGLSWNRWIRVILVLVYLGVWMTVTIFAGLTYECSLRNCL